MCRRLPVVRAQYRGRVDGGMPTPWGARRILSSALIDLGTLASQVSSRLARLEAAPSTDAGRWAVADPGTGMRMVFSSLMAGTDHFHAFARLLRKEEPYVLSLAALARAFGEVMGRAWWLLDARSAEQFAHRAAALHLTEVLEASGETIATRNAGGIRTVVDDPRREAEQQLAAVAVAGVRERMPDYSRLFHQVSEASGVDGKGVTYAELSAATHGSSLSIGGMSHIGPRDHEGWAVVNLAFSIDHAEPYLWTLVRITEGVLHRLAEAYNARSELERIDAAVARVDDTCRKVLTVLRENGGS